MLRCNKLLLRVYETLHTMDIKFIAKIIKTGAVIV